MFNSNINSSKAINYIFVVNYHYKVIDVGEISFFDIKSRTYCIPINPVNTQDEN